jgi:hypothetical protein
MELDHTPKREIVLDDLIYKCTNLKKIIEVRNYLFQGSKQSYTTQFPNLEKFFRISLIISHL